jgi:hypothetical protein
MDKPKEEEEKPVILQEGLDYYKEGQYLVFTAHYHLKRGSCCGSGCRHCPYRKSSLKRGGGING